MIPDRYLPLNLFNVFMVILKYGFYIPCKYCIAIPYKHCTTIPYNCKRRDKSTEHNEHHIIQEKYNDLNEKYKQVEIVLNSLIEMNNENIDDINGKFNELLRSVNILLENKFNEIDNKVSILENKELNNKIKKTSIACYRGRNIH